MAEENHSVNKNKHSKISEYQSDLLEKQIWLKYVIRVNSCGIAGRVKRIVYVVSRPMADWNTNIRKMT